MSNWPLRLWDFNKHYQFIGGAGGEGVGYLAPAALGAAIANKKHGRLSVSIQSDGDLMMANGVLWTAAHHRVPLLTVMHNNRAYHQEIMQLQRVANQHNRGVDIDKCKIGTAIEKPNIDYAMLAKSMGVQAEGPISDPKDLSAAIRRGIRRGQGRRPVSDRRHHAAALGRRRNCMIRNLIADRTARPPHRWPRNRPAMRKTASANS